jgi:SAM-dependent methyltransferase
MKEPEPRAGDSFYYDFDEEPLPDIPFYLEQMPQGTSVLELGCGTGRLLSVLAPGIADVWS